MICAFSILCLTLFQGIIERDRIVFDKVRKRCIPILMVTSGGYQKTTARIIADSILNLRRNDLIKCDGAEAFQNSSKAKCKFTIILDIFIETYFHFDIVCHSVLHVTVNIF